MKLESLPGGRGQVVISKRMPQMSLVQMVSDEALTLALGGVAALRPRRDFRKQQRHRD